MRRTITFAAAAALSLTFFAAPGGAAQPRGNSDAAKLCQNGGFADYERADGTAFADEGACTSYAARGGTLTNRSVTPLEECQERHRLPGIPVPEDVVYILGTPGDDIYTGTAATEVFCGFGGTDYFRNMEPDDVAHQWAGGNLIMCPADYPGGCPESPDF